MTPVRTSIPLAVAAGLLITSCGGGGGGGGGTTGPNPPPLPSGDVQLLATSFNPQNLSVESGEEVVWVNALEEAHTITPDGHTEWARHVVPRTRGHTFSAVMDEAGSFPYHCEIHGAPGSGMHGTITVTE